ncbi:hypothetical protein F5876DRAFT_68193 [Lentinula aff. lateritia]|uniref:Uncharacterized protein n=1 Tax=Lentinula aff. lateritia TaxID=2804960 RepID=A0ACC1TRU6_9AGAR|nr:hypothetical protein F5876DRAFT_68193 [Lentinula aff. lateritia]
MACRFGLEESRGLASGSLVSAESLRYQKMADNLCAQGKPNEAAPFMFMLKAMEDKNNVDTFTTFAFVHQNYCKALEVLEDGKLLTYSSPVSQLPPGRNSVLPPGRELYTPQEQEKMASYESTISYGAALAAFRLSGDYEESRMYLCAAVKANPTVMPKILRRSERPRWQLSTPAQGHRTHPKMRMIIFGSRRTFGWKRMFGTGFMLIRMPNKLSEGLFPA